MTMSAVMLCVLATAHAPAASLPSADSLRIIFAQSPALLILIHGEPVYRRVTGTALQRVTNTEPLIVRDDDGGMYYLKIFDGWMEAYTLTGLWSAAGMDPDGVAQALKQAGANVDLLTGGGARGRGPRPRMDTMPLPTVYVSTTPAVLITTDGAPHFAPVDGTTLLYLTNTASLVLKEPTDQELYVRVSRRWFRSWTTDGPWDYVPNKDLPGDFAAIPDRLLNKQVKASIGGTASVRDGSDEPSGIRRSSVMSDSSSPISVWSLQMS
jgi:hypothetical protein